MTPQMITIIFLSISTIGLLVITVVSIHLVEDLRIERVKLKTELLYLHRNRPQIAINRQQSEINAKQ